MVATKWFKRARSFFPVEVHINRYPAAKRVRLTLATTGTDSADWLDLEMDEQEAAEIVRRLQEVLK